jgi:hypothetical protein
MFLTPNEICELTGYVRASAQRRWLTRQGIRFWVRADGKPAVVVDQVIQKSSVPQKWQPDLSVMEHKR